MPSSKSGASDLELQVSKQDFYKELQLLQGIIERKNTMPILSNLLLVASKNSIVLTASDLEVALRIQMEADVRQGGSATIPAKKIFEIVRELPDLSTISLKKLDNNFVEIRCGSSYFKLPGMAVDEYPSLPEVESQKTVTLPAAVLKEMIRR